MTYVLVTHLIHQEDDPSEVYSEMDENRMEVRRLEFYQNGIHFQYGEENGNCEALAKEPFPEDLGTLNRPGEVAAQVISARTFWDAWNQALESPSGFMGIFL